MIFVEAGENGLTKEHHVKTLENSITLEYTICA